LGPEDLLEAGTEVTTQEAGEMEEETLFVDDMTTATDSSGWCRAEEDELDDRAQILMGLP
jgi:hypothetical protein